MYLQITEGIIDKKQRSEVKVQCSEVKVSCSKKLLDLNKCLYSHARKKTKLYFRSGLEYVPYAIPTTDCYLYALSGDNSEHKCNSESSKSFCPGLSEVSKHLTELKGIIQTLP